MKTVLFFFTSILLVSCLGIAAYGQTPDDDLKKFQPDSNHAVVIFYRSSAWGGAYTYKLCYNDSALTRIRFESVYPVKVIPGMQYFYAKNGGGRQQLYFNTLAGHVYFVKCGLGFGPFISPPDMKLLPDEEAKKELDKKFLKEHLKAPVLNYLRTMLE